MSHRDIWAQVWCTCWVAQDATHEPNCPFTCKLLSLDCPNFVFNTDTFKPCTIFHYRRNLQYTNWRKAMTLAPSRCHGVTSTFAALVLLPFALPDALSLCINKAVSFLLQPNLYLSNLSTKTCSQHMFFHIVSSKPGLWFDPIHVILRMDKFLHDHN